MKRIALIVTVLVVAVLLVGVIVWRQDLGKMDFGRLPGRGGWQLPDIVVAHLGLEAGDRVADLGSGDGYFTFALAEAVGPDGTVFAVDIDSTVLDEVEAEAAKRGLQNIVAVEGRTDDPLLEDGTIDLVFLCNAYHHIDDRPAYFRRLRRDLGPDGRVAVVEPRTEGFARVVSPPGHATGLDHLRREMASAGYRPVASFDDLPLQHFEIFAPIAGTPPEAPAAR